MKQKILYLNQADGRVVPELKSLKIKNASLLFKRFTKAIRKILSLSNKDFLGFAQNATSSLIYGLLPILKKNKDITILISNHEIRWYKKLFVTGKLPIQETTYPNYAPQIKIDFIKKKTVLFDPEIFVKKPEKFLSSKKPVLIILSHVSRLTGELFITPKLYQRIKKINKDNIVVIDGCQAVGAAKVAPHTISDFYVGVTSKFIGAEPHIAFYWINQRLVKKYNIIPQSINPKLFFREIYSAVCALNILNKKGLDVHELRTYFEKKLKDFKISFLKLKNQQDYIILIPENRSKITNTIKKLKQHGVIVSSNILFSIREPKHPSLRVSVVASLKRKDIDHVVELIAKIKS